MGVEGPGVECGQVYGPPCTSGGSLTFVIVTEANIPITTESGQRLLTEASP